MLGGDCFIVSTDIVYMFSADIDVTRTAHILIDLGCLALDGYVARTFDACRNFAAILAIYNDIARTIE